MTELLLALGLIAGLSPVTRLVFGYAHDAAVQMIDTSIVRVHQHAACIIRNTRQSMGRSRGSVTSKIHALVDTNGLPVRLALTAGEAHDNRVAAKLLCESVHYLGPDARSLPASEAIVTSGVRSEVVRQVAPRRPRS